MRSAILGFALGVALLQNEAALPQQYVLALQVATALAFLVFSRRIARPALKVVMLGAGGALTGFAWAALFAAHYLVQELPREWEGRDLTVVGTVDSLPYYVEQGARFNFAVERIVAPAEAAPSLPPRLALSWYAVTGADGRTPAITLQPGERWQLTVRLRRPHGNANPYGFDYEVWLLEQNLRATGAVRPDQDLALKNRRLDEFVTSFGSVVQRGRSWLRDRIVSALPDKPYAGVIVALVIGDQRAVSQSDWTVFNRTGVSHLISISGLHVTMVAAMFAGLVFALWRRSFFTRADLPLLLPAQKAAALAGALVALLYVLLAGFGVPAQRTLYMLSVVAAALWFGRLTSVSHVLCVALGVVVLLDPWAVLWPGFWLSFGAVAVILFASVGRVRSHAQQSPGLGKWRAAAQSAIRTQYAVTIGLVPLTLLLFGQISLVSPIANAVAIPLVSFLVTPAALAGSVLPAPLGGWILGFAHLLVEQLAHLLSWLAAFPAAVWAAPIPSWWAFAAALVGILWLLAPAGWPVRWLGAVGLLPVVLSVPSQPREGEMWVTAFDIGQGTALLVETAHHRLLYDTGPAYAPDSDGASRVILPYLKARGIRSLDGVIVSHSDADHAGGALSLFEEIEIDWVSTSLPADHPVRRKAANHRRCEAGQSWSWDGAAFEMLHPSAASYDSTKWKPNARSCTLKVTLGGRALLLPGDIEAVQETELVEGGAQQLRAEVLLAPHHGSGTSSTPAFLQAVQPQIALFQVGYRNRYRHPKPEIYERYGEMGIKRLRSDGSGAVALHFADGLEVTEYRREHARYWYGR